MQGAPTNPFHENLPRQILALAGWVAFWVLAERLMRGMGLEGRRQLAVFLALLSLVGGGAALAARGRAFLLLSSVRFAVAQGAWLIAAVLSAMLGGPGLLGGLWFRALLALLAASMLAVTWKRRPYDLARTGFLLVHVAPSLALLGTLWDQFAGAPGPGLWLIRISCAGFLAGCAWMFYLKPVLKRREARP
jgi:hypothetical protein